MQKNLLGEIMKKDETAIYSFKELRKGAKKEVLGKEIRLAILGNCATQFFAVAIKGYARLSEVNLNVYDADYNQIDAQLLEPSSEVYCFKPDVILLWLATDKLYEEFLDSSLEERKNFAEKYIAQIRWYWELISRNTNARMLQMNFTETDDKVLGHYSAKQDGTFIYQIRKLNYLLQEEMRMCKNVYPVDLLSVQIQLGQNRYYNASFYYSAKMSASTDALPYIAKAVTEVLRSMCGKIKKCVVLDLDNTLWGGVIGDDGMEHIEIGELGRGHVFTNFQRWLKQLKEYGIILAVCSKNNENIAREPFEKHEEMILRMEDISLFVANWNDKASNIRLIQETLNIGMDSIVFIDDNPFERNLVREAIPEVEVPELPEDPAEYLEFLQKCNYFDTITFSGDSSERTKQYQAEIKRKRAEENFDSIEGYLKSLEMVGEAKEFDEKHAARIAQLTQRSNQFNLRTIRYTEEEIGKIIESRDRMGIYYTLSDKYGEHGLVGVIILNCDGESAFIDTWLMSCRVLKRGMEEFIINQMIEKIRKKGIKKLLAEYIPTAKNEMVRNIYLQMGFREVTENQYELYVEDYKTQEVFIKEKV